MNIESELKTIEQEEAKLAQRKNDLLTKQKEEEALQAKLENLVQTSGFFSPKDLVEALIEKYNLRVGKRGPATKGKRRTRTKVTKELCDAIKNEVNGGTSMNAASRKFEVSYVVVSKVMKGKYDNL